MSHDATRPPFHDVVEADAFRAATPADAIDGVTPRWVVTPGSVSQVAAVLRIAHQHDLAVVARGLGRHLSLGEPPRRVDVVVSLERMDRVLAHEPADMTVQVEAGCSLLALGAALYESKQWLPLDPPFAPNTTVGGLLATNLSGPLRTSQGTARDLLIGLRTVGPDGTVVSGGGRVVKNVAGYDLCKMHIGALGTLGIIVEATFKVRPRPPHEDALEVACSGGERAAAIALEMRDACEPFWLQLVSEEGPRDDWTLVVGAGGRAEEVAAALERYRDVAHAHDALSRVVAGAAGLRHGLADRSAHAERVVLRVATLPTRVGPRLGFLESAATRLGTKPSLHADVACGVIRASFDPSVDIVKLVAETRPTIERDGGSLVVENASPAQKARLNDVGGVWGDPGPGLPLMRGLKEAFDPAARLAPGRFVGGL